MQFVKIEDFNHLYYGKRPLFIIVAGGLATGKSHVVREHITAPYIVADFDDFMQKFGYTDYDKKGMQWQHAMKEVDKYIQYYKQRRQPIISQGTSGSYKWLKFRAEESKSLGYDIALLHIHAPLSQALAQNAFRKAQRKHFVIPRDIYLLETTAIRAKANYTVLYKEEPQLVSYVCEYDNTKPYPSRF